MRGPVCQQNNIACHGGVTVQVGIDYWGVLRIHIVRIKCVFKYKVASGPNGVYWSWYMDSWGLHGKSLLPRKTVDPYTTSNKLPAGVQLQRRKFAKRAFRT